MSELRFQSEIGRSFLSQSTYKNDNGREIDASVIEAIAPYLPQSDGFYRWPCAKCGAEHGDRSCGWDISGQVLKCQKCGAMNLLVRTNCAELTEALSGKWRSNERDVELERLRGIQRLNTEDIARIERLAREKAGHLIGEAFRELASGVRQE